MSKPKTTTKKTTAKRASPRKRTRQPLEQPTQPEPVATKPKIGGKLGRFIRAERRKHSPAAAAKRAEKKALKGARQPGPLTPAQKARQKAEAAGRKAGRKAYDDRRDKGPHVNPPGGTAAEEKRPGWGDLATGENQTASRFAGAVAMGFATFIRTMTEEPGEALADALRMRERLGDPSLVRIAEEGPSAMLHEQMAAATRRLPPEFSIHRGPGVFMVVASDDLEVLPVGYPNKIGPGSVALARGVTLAGALLLAADKWEAMVEEFPLLRSEFTPENARARARPEPEAQPATVQADERFPSRIAIHGLPRRFDVQLDGTSESGATLFRIYVANNNQAVPEGHPTKLVPGPGSWLGLSEAWGLDAALKHAREVYAGLVLDYPELAQPHVDKGAEGPPLSVRTPNPPQAGEGLMPTIFDCGCSHLKVRAGMCDHFTTDGKPREEPRGFSSIGETEPTCSAQNKKRGGPNDIDHLSTGKEINPENGHGAADGFGGSDYPDGGPTPPSGDRGRGVV